MNYTEFKQMCKQAAEEQAPAPTVGDRLVGFGNSLPDSYNLKARLPFFGNRTLLNMDRIGNLVDYRGLPEPRWYNSQWVKVKRNVGKVQRGLDSLIDRIYNKYTPAGGAPVPPEYETYKQWRKANINSMPSSQYENRMPEQDVRESQVGPNSMPKSFYLGR